MLKSEKLTWNNQHSPFPAGQLRSVNTKQRAVQLAPPRESWVVGKVCIARTVDWGGALPEGEEKGTWQGER